MELKKDTEQVYVSALVPKAIARKAAATAALQGLSRSELFRRVLIEAIERGPMSEVRNERQPA